MARALGICQVAGNEDRAGATGPPYARLATNPERTPSSSVVLEDFEKP